MKRQECDNTLQLETEGGLRAAIEQAIPVPGKRELAMVGDEEATLVVVRGPRAFIVSSRCTLTRTLTHGLGLPPPPPPTTATGAAAPAPAPAASRSRAAWASPHDFVAGAVSPSGRYAYLAAVGGALWVFATATGKVAAHVPSISAADREVLGLLHHPQRSVLASYGKEFMVRFWKPAEGTLDGGASGGGGGGGGSSST